MIYSIFASGLIAITLIIDIFVLKTCVVCQKKTWKIFAFLCLLTFIFDSVLVSLPIVTYVHSALSGVRIGTIPLEDFSYTFVAVILPLSVRAYFNRT